MSTVVCAGMLPPEMPKVLLMLLREVEQVIEDFDAGEKLMQEHVPLQLPR